MEQKYEALNTRVESLESKDSASSENVKEMILEEMAELIRVGDVEQKYEGLNTRVESLESKDSTSSENVKEMILEEMAELKEIEGKRLNIICLNLPESKQLESADRQQEDIEFLSNVFESNE